VRTPPREGDRVHRAAKTATCPHCGLVLAITLDKIDTRVRFGVKEWQRRCRYPDLDSPVLCLAERGSRSET
jgi:hypothetical protein